MKIIRFDGYFRTLLLSGLIFLLIYNVSLKSLEVFTSARLAVVILFLWAVKKRSNMTWILKSRIWILFIPLPYVIIQYFVVGDFGQLSRFIHLGLYSILGAGFAVAISRNIKDLILSIFIAINVQAGFIFLSFFSVDYRNWFELVFVSGSNFDATYVYRASGLAGGGGAALSLIQSLGVFLGWLLLRKNAIYESARGGSSYLVILGMIFSTASCVVVGRTGLLLSIIFWMIFILNSPFRFRYGLFVLSVFFLFQVFFFEKLFGLLDSDFSVDYFSNWALGFLTGDDQTVSALGEQPIPPLSMQTFHGTGLNSVIDGANPSGHDSGFIQAYYSMGLPFSIIFFLAYLYVLSVCLEWLPFLIRFFLVLLFFAIEVKEPFVFKYSLMFVLVVLHFSFVRLRTDEFLVKRS